jgi:hypothetical protein
MTLCLPAPAGRNFALYFVSYLGVAAWRAVFWEVGAVFVCLIVLEIDLESVIRQERNLEEPWAFEFLGEYKYWVLLE